MKKTLVFLVVLALLLPSGWINSGAGAAWLGATSPANSTRVTLAVQAGQAAAAPADISSQLNLLYPEAIDPPENCHVPKMAPLGQDLEVMLGPWIGPNALLALDQPSSWSDEAYLSEPPPGVQSSTDLAVIALNTEELVAIWADSSSYGRIKYATWGAGLGWVIQGQLSDQSPSGKPALISRGPTHWAVFARFGTAIQVREWYMGSLGDWSEPIAADATSDPVVVSEDAGHMAIFYLTTASEVKFNEWEGAWLKAPVSLGQPSDGKATLSIASELSAVSRNENHSAVFGVDAAGGLWIKERTSQDEADWSDTNWVKLLEGVKVEKPAVASRHANHMGVVVKDSQGRPYYTRWAWAVPQKLYLPLVGRPSAGTKAVYEEEPAWTQSVTAAGPPGWSQPLQLGEPSFTSTLTLVPRSNDALLLLGVQADGNLYESVWTEEGGWGSWQAIAGPGMLPQQVVAAVMRRMNDVMLLGRYADNQVWYQHYTSLNKPVTEDALSTALEGLPHGQTLVFVEGRWVWVSVTREITGTWQVEARELGTGVSGYLALSNHGDSGQAENRLAVAAADLDVAVDSSAEVVVATLQSNRSDIDLSVLKLSFPDPATLAISTASFMTWDDPLGGEDVNLAIGDLDGDQQRDEVVVGYRASGSIRLGVFQYTGSGLASRGTTEISNKDWCAGLGCTIGDHDLEIAIGRVFREITPPIEREQLIVFDASQVITGTKEYAQDWVLMRRLLTDTWTLDPIAECSLLNPATNSGTASTIAGDPYTAGVGAGDVDANGLANIVYSFGDRLAVLMNTNTCEYREIAGLPDTQRILAMGDIDTDARSEAILGYRGATTEVELFEMVEQQLLRLSAEYTVNGGHTVLIADTDNDTRLAELAGCKTFSEVRVVGVVNGAPRWYEDGLPIHGNNGLYGRTETGGGGSSDGTTQTYGGSLSLGFEVEINLPVAAVKTGEVRGNVTQEFMGSSGTTQSTVWAQTQEAGYEYESTSRGMVIYNSTEFKCFYYNVYPPDAPESKTRAMLCTPSGIPGAEGVMALEDWDNYQDEAGPSWVDVGHRSPAGVHSNDLEVLNNYPPSSPVDPSHMKYTWDGNPIKVSYSSQSGLTSYWHISDMTGGETATDTSFESNTTLSLGLTAWYITIDLAGTYGKSWEWSSVTSWENTLEMGGAVELFPDPSRPCYYIRPYVYTARARTQAGVLYSYLETDYYVPEICARAGRAAFGLDGRYPYDVQGWSEYLAIP